MKHKLSSLLIVPLLLASLLASSLTLFPASAAAYACPNMKGQGCTGCGSGTDFIKTTIDFGCMGDACARGQTSGYCNANHNGLLDILFSIVRFLTDGVGLIIIASLIIAGIQYSFSRGDPNGVKAATTRIRSSATALVLFIFIYALINYVVPQGLFG